MFGSAGGGELMGVGTGAHKLVAPAKDHNDRTRATITIAALLRIDKSHHERNTGRSKKCEKRNKAMNQDTEQDGADSIATILRV